MEYKDFEYDFVERTLRNIEWIEKQNSIVKDDPTSMMFYEFAYNSHTTKKTDVFSCFFKKNMYICLRIRPCIGFTKD